jgi:TPR repeat protein
MRKWYVRAIELNYMRAYADLGQIYLSGRGVRRNYAKASSLLQTALEAGVLGAHGPIGEMYFRGNGRPRSYAKALEHFLLDPAPNIYTTELAYMYRHGLGIGRDPEGAIKWYRTALIKGRNYATYEIGTMYWNGEVAEPDSRAKALAWFLLGAGYGGSKSARMVERLKSELNRVLARKAVVHAKTISGEIIWDMAIFGYLNKAPGGFSE